MNFFNGFTSTLVPDSHNIIDIIMIQDKKTYQTQS